MSWIEFYSPSLQKSARIEVRAGTPLTVAPEAETTPYTAAKTRALWSINKQLGRAIETPVADLAFDDCSDDLDIEDSDYETCKSCTWDTRRDEAACVHCGALKDWAKTA